MDEKEMNIKDETTPEPAKDGPEAVAWVIPGQDNANCNGFIDAMAWEEGEFSKPLIRLSDYEALRAENERLRESGGFAKPTVEERLVARVGRDKAAELALSGKSLYELAAIADGLAPAEPEEQ